jgi:superoxide reductase
MVRQVEQGPEPGGEMHVPVIRKSGNGIKVSVASVANPMEEDQYIEWIEVTNGNDRYVRLLSPGDPPVAEFALTGPGIKARVYCEERGLWSDKPSGPKI